MIRSTGRDCIPWQGAAPDRFRIAAAALSIAATLLGTSSGLAQRKPGDLAAAEALFLEARALVKAGDYAAGCPKFDASLALNPSSASTVINIGQCREHDGKLATAVETYRRALALNQATPEPDRRRALGEIAQQRIDALEPRVPKLRVVVAQPPAGLKVLCDGEALPAGALGMALPAEPGEHQVSSSAPGYRAETRSVLLEEGKTATLEVALVREGAPRGSWLPAGIAFGVGAIGLGVGAVTGGLSLAKVSDIKSRCEGNSCLVADQEQGDAAGTLATVSTVGFIAGGLGAAAGVVLLVLRSGNERTPDTAFVARPAPAVSFSVGIGPGRIDVQGRF